jgi:hypothetical protein
MRTKQQPKEQGQARLKPSKKHQGIIGRSKTKMSLVSNTRLIRGSSSKESKTTTTNTVFGSI